ncbi:hypothetical protein GCM10017688_31940 [Streptomyces ramulosus]
MRTGAAASAVRRETGVRRAAGAVGAAGVSVRPGIGGIEVTFPWGPGDDRAATASAPVYGITPGHGAHHADRGRAVPGTAAPVAREPAVRRPLEPAACRRRPDLTVRVPAPGGGLTVRPDRGPATVAARRYCGARLGPAPPRDPAGPGTTARPAPPAPRRTPRPARLGAPHRAPGRGSPRPAPPCPGQGLPRRLGPLTLSAQIR